MSSSATEMKEYIQEWKKLEVKPSNDLIFVSNFIEYINQIDCENFEFGNGENGYCGYTAYLFETNPKYKMSSGREVLDFEFAYGSDFVKVFYLHNDGYWTPEYIDLKGVSAEMILNILKNKSLQLHGFAPAIAVN